MPAACTFDIPNRHEHQPLRSGGVASVGDPHGNIPIPPATPATSGVRAGYSVVRHGRGEGAWAGKD